MVFELELAGADNFRSPTSDGELTVLTVDEKLGSCLCLSVS